MRRRCGGPGRSKGDRWGGSEVLDRSRVPSQGLLDAVLAVSSGANLEATVRRIVQAAVDLVSARYGAVTILGRAGQLDHFVQVGVDAAAGTPIGSEPCGGGVLDAMVSDGQPLRLDDVTKHSAFVGFPPGHPPMRTFLGAPIRSAGRVVGRLYLTGKTGGQVFTDDDTRTVQALADAVGMAVDNAQVFQQARRARQWLEAASNVTSELLGSGDTGPRAEPDRRPCDGAQRGRHRDGRAAVGPAGDSVGGHRSAGRGVRRRRRGRPCTI